MEIWKDVVGYEGLYQVSNYGTVKSLPKRIGAGTGYIKNEQKLKQAKNEIYPVVFLKKDGKLKRCYIHRLVAQAFIPNPDNKREVNHINGVKTDNRPENLEWCSSSENIRHAYKTGLIPTVAVLQFDLCGNFLNEWSSNVEAAKQTGCSSPHISSCCKGRRKKTGGYIWRYKEAE